MNPNGQPRYKALSFIGKTVNGFQVLRFIYAPKGHAYVSVICPHCKKRCVRAFNNLQYMKSCGCRERMKHGGCGTPEYGVWSQMKQRCSNPRSVGYSDYGARGIRIDPRWETFANFIADMGKRPSSNHTLERKNSNGPYAKWNVIWALRIVQDSNRRNVRLIIYKGETKTMSGWARTINITLAGLRSRLKRMTVEQALTQPVAGGRRTTPVRFDPKESDWRYTMRALRQAQMCGGPRKAGECPICEKSNEEHLPYCMVGRAIEKYAYRTLRKKGLVR